MPVIHFAVSVRQAKCARTLRCATNTDLLPGEWWHIGLSVALGPRAFGLPYRYGKNELPA